MKGRVGISGKRGWLGKGGNGCGKKIPRRIKKKRKK